MVSGCRFSIHSAGSAASSTWKRLPLPGVLSTRKVPLWARMIPTTAASPKPRPRNFVVKNGSKIRARVASSIPMPVSSTSIVT